MVNFGSVYGEQLAESVIETCVCVYVGNNVPLKTVLSSLEGLLLMKKRGWYSTPFSTAEQQFELKKKETCPWWGRLSALELPIGRQSVLTLSKVHWLSLQH